MRRVAFLLAFAAGCYAPKIADGGFACSPDDRPACPEGFQCIGGVCLSGPPPAAPLIAKTGAPYTGAHFDPVLNDADACPDAALEPDDDPTTAYLAPLGAPDLPAAKLTQLAICPTGPNPKTGRHDLDYFEVDTTGRGTLTVEASIAYDIRYGDLDLALVDRRGNVLAADGSAVSNGCVAARVAAGIYYVVVAGAAGTGVNRYDAQVKLLTASTGCLSGGDVPVPPRRAKLVEPPPTARYSRD